MELRNKEHDVVLRKKRKWFALAFTVLLLGVFMVGLYLFYEANEKPQIIPNGDTIGSNEIDNSKQNE